MKVSDIPFNMSSVSDSTYYDRPADPDEMLKGVDFILEKIEQSSERKIKASLHSLVGHYFKVLNKLEEAKQHLQIAIESFELEGLSIPALIAQYRLGQVHLRFKSYTKAEDCFYKVLYEVKKGESPHLERIHDGILFHLALSKKEQGVNSQASEFISECLELRVVKGDLELIGQCQQMLTDLDS